MIDSMAAMKSDKRESRKYKMMKIVENELHLIGKLKIAGKPLHKLKGFTYLAKKEWWLNMGAKQLPGIISQLKQYRREQKTLMLKHQG